MTITNGGYKGCMFTLAYSKDQMHPLIKFHQMVPVGADQMF